MVVRLTTLVRPPHVFSDDDIARMALLGISPGDPPRFSVADYERLIEANILREGHRVELLRGEVVEKMPIGTRHAAAVNRLAKLLVFRADPVASMSSQNPIVLADSEPEPDGILLVYRADDYANDKPTAADAFLVVEIADSSLADDLGWKAELYAENGIPEYWVIDLANDRVHVHRGPNTGGTWTTVTAHGRGDTLTVAALSGVVVAVDELLP